MEPTKENLDARKMKIIRKMKADVTERTLFNAGRHLMCELLSSGLDVEFIKEYIDMTFGDHEEYRRGALAELELWT